jgi:DNA repair protein RadC
MKVREIQLIYKTSENLTIEERTMDSPKNVFKFLKDKIGCATEERFVVLLLNNKSRLLDWHEASVGTATESLVHPREIFKAAVRILATSIIVAHNHPSGTLGPSREDITTTERLKEAGKIMGIPVLDHIIVTSEGYTSLKEQGYL